MNRFVWLASYPKSGNTWFRVFLSNYLCDANAPVDINHLVDGPIASARSTFDATVGYDSSDLLADEIERLRPEVYLHLAEHATAPLYCKAHDAYTTLSDGRALFPPAATSCAIYFVRNPLDVCVSLASHFGHNDIARVVAEIGDRTHALFAKSDRERNQLPQKLLTWSAHVLSWVDAPAIRVHVVRYEDLKLDPEETFAFAVQFLGLPYDSARLRRAVEFSRFEELRRQEDTVGFGEKLPCAPSFFRQGEVGAWRAVLSTSQVQRVIADHRAVMMRMGYLAPSGEPLF